MGLKQVKGKKVPANYSGERQVNVRDPMLIIYTEGKAQMNVRCGDLEAVTGVNDTGIIEKVKAFAENLPDEEAWTKEQVADLCRQVGRMPFPKLLQVEHLEGQGTLLMRVAGQEGPGVTDLSYAKRSNRPAFNVGPVLQKENIAVPEGMCLEVPVALVMDEGVLKVEARLLQGEERAVKQQAEAEVAAAEE
jgi:hypothetical protein